MRDSTPILLVEDDPVDVMSVQRAARAIDLRNPVHVVGTGREALDYLRGDGDYDGRGDAPRPGLILLDMDLPIMNGLEFLDVAKADPGLREIPVVVLSSSDLESDIRASFRRGVAGYVVKPKEFASFIEALRTIESYWELSCTPSAQSAD
jgi:CheY-like chemotaxis protein